MDQFRGSRSGRLRHRPADRRVHRRLSRREPAPCPAAPAGGAPGVVVCARESGALTATRMATSSRRRSPPRAGHWPGGNRAAAGGVVPQCPGAVVQNDKPPTGLDEPRRHRVLALNTLVSGGHCREQHRPRIGGRWQSPVPRYGPAPRGMTAIPAPPGSRPRRGGGSGLHSTDVPGRDRRARAGTDSNDPRHHPPVPHQPDRPPRPRPDRGNHAPVRPRGPRRRGRPWPPRPGGVHPNGAGEATWRRGSALRLRLGRRPRAEPRPDGHATVSRGRSDRRSRRRRPVEQPGRQPPAPRQRPPQRAGRGPAGIDRATAASTATPVSTAGRGTSAAP